MAKDNWDAEYTEAVTKIQAAEDAELTKKSAPFKVLTSADLDHGDYTVDYLIDNCMVRGQTLVIGGPLKTLKTSILIALAVALARGRGKFLSRFNVNCASSVLVMSAESGLPTLQETARRICKSLGIKLSDLKHLFWSDELPRLDDRFSIAKLVNTIRANEIEVVALDPLMLALGGTDHGNLYLQGQRFQAIKVACDEAGAQLILCHHFTKSAGNNFKPPVLSDLSQSGLGEFARSWLLLKRRKPYRADGVHDLWLDAGGSAGHCGLYELKVSEGLRTDDGGRKWEIEIDLFGQSKSERQKQDYQQDRTRILEALATKPLTKFKLHKASAVPRRTLDAILIAMVDDGALIHSGDDKRKLYSLPQAKAA